MWILLVFIIFFFFSLFSIRIDRSLPRSLKDRWHRMHRCHYYYKGICHKLTMFRSASNNFIWFSFYSNHIYGNENHKFQIKLINTNIFLFFCQTNRCESCILQLKMLIFPRLESKLLIALNSNRKFTVKLNDWMDRNSSFFFFCKINVN